MRIWKIVLGAAVLIGATSAAGVYVIGRNGLELGSGTAGAATPPAVFAMPVPVTSVIKRTIPIYLDYPGRTESIRNVTLKAKVSGYIQKQNVDDGVDVKQGDLLYELDQRDFEAALDQVKAQVQRDTASLDYARSNLGRGTELAKTGFLTKDSFDQRTSALGEAQASLAIDQAAVHTAELNLGYTEIRAPFAGRMGRNQAPVGTLVSVGGSVLNTLVQLDPIYVTFNPSETDLAALQAARAGGKIEADISVPGVSAPRKGELTFIDNAVDQATGTITARATIPNPDHALLPGQYVRIRLSVGSEPDALMVPQIALGASQLGKYLYVIGKGNTVDQRFVSLGASDGELISITKGIAEGDQVIEGNLQKIGPGSPVQPLPQKASSGS